MIKGNYSTDNRDETIDVIKGIGIVSVVLGHVWSVTDGLNVPTYYSIGHTFVYYYHIIIFVFCSGYLFKNKNAKDFVFGKIKTLYIPSVLFGTASLLLYPLFYITGVVNEISIKQLIKKFISILSFTDNGLIVGPIWFLEYLFLVVIIFYILFNISIRLKWKLSLIVFSLIVGVIALIGIMCFGIFDNIFIRICKRYYVFQALLSVPFMTLGYYSKKYDLIKKVSKYLWIPSFLVLLIVAVNTDLYIDIKFGEIGKYYFYIISLVGLIFAVSLANFVIKIKVISKTLCVIGKFGLDIMATHKIMFKIIDIIICYVIIHDTQKINIQPVSFPRYWIVYVILSIAFITTTRYLIMRIKKRRNSYG